MKKPEDVFDTMLDNKVGTCFANTYAKISEYYENELLDYRKADKIMRVAMKNLMPTELDDPYGQKKGEPLSLKS